VSEGEMTLVMSTAESAVLSSLLGLGIAIMQQDKEVAERFGESLSNPIVPDIAHSLMTKVVTMISPPMRVWEEDS
jgi:hypothetical protein